MSSLKASSANAPPDELACAGSGKNLWMLWPVCMMIFKGRFEHMPQDVFGLFFNTFRLPPVGQKVVPSGGSTNLCCESLECPKAPCRLNSAQLHVDSGDFSSLQVPRPPEVRRPTEQPKSLPILLLAPSCRHQPCIFFLTLLRWMVLSK